MAGRYDLRVLNARPIGHATLTEQALLQLLAASGWNVRGNRVWVFTVKGVPHVSLEVTSGTTVIVPHSGTFVPIYHTDRTNFSRILAGLQPGLTPQEFERVIAW